MAQLVITIVGGTGFLGRYVVKRLAAAGHTIRVISRHPDAALELKTAGDVGQIVLAGGDLTRPETLAGKLDYSYAVVNLAGIMFERGSQNFTAVQAHGAEKLAQMAKAAGAQRFIHVSALGVDKAPGSAYARSKMLGEKAVMAAFPEATILRPSVMFGPEDDFFNRFAAMPFLPVIGGGRTRFQPVYVGDVARAIETCITSPTAMGRMYELGGPQVYSFRELLAYTMRVIGKKRPFLPVPFSIAPVIGFGCELAAHLPFVRKPLLTRDQVRLLRYDNVVAPNALTIANLGIQPSAIEIIAPEYLARFTHTPIIPRVAQ